VLVNPSMSMILDDERLSIASLAYHEVGHVVFRYAPEDELIT
jgi:hypothetical protein